MSNNPLAISSLPAYLQGAVAASATDFLDSFKMSSGTSMFILQVGRDGELRVRQKGETKHSIMAPAFDGHIVEIKRPRAYFVEGTKEPRCKSSDSVVGVGDIGNGPGQRKCSECPMSQWDTDPKGGKGQACKQTVSVAMMPSNIVIAQDGGDAIFLARKQMAWWFDISEVPFRPYSDPQFICGAAKDLFPDGKYAMKKVVLRITASSFRRWDKLIEDFKALGDGWPLFAPIISVTSSSSDLKDSRGGSNRVGFWEFKVSPCGERNQMTVMEAQRVHSESGNEDIGEAGHEADGIVS